jgi:hypothetical protein
MIHHRHEESILGMQACFKTYSKFILDIKTLKRKNAHGSIHECRKCGKLSMYYYKNFQ